jgi:very-short-patch-repair endonuclease
VDLVTLSGAFEHAWRTRRVSPVQLEQRLANVDAGRRGAAALKRIARGARGRHRPMESILEVRLWWMLKQAGFPSPESQYEIIGPHLGRIRLDFAYPSRGLAIETDSMAFHGDKAFFLAHCARLTRLAAAGWRVMHFTKDALADERRVLPLVRAALSQRRPAIAATSRSRNAR